MHEEEAARAEQLRKGVAGAAAALPAGEAALGQRAVEAVDLLVARLRDVAPAPPAPGEDGARKMERIAQAVALVERLHYHLVKAAVMGGSAEELGVPGEVEEVRRAAEELGGLVAAGGSRPEAVAPAEPGAPAPDPKRGGTASSGGEPG